MHVHRPCLVLVPDTFIAIADTVDANTNKKPNTTSLLVECIQDEFPEIPIEPVQRKYWNDDAGASPTVSLACHIITSRAGLQFISQLCVQDDERAATLLAASSKYA
jgi:DNA mismatch repair protein MSH4